MRSRAQFDPGRRRAVLLPLSVAAVGGLGLAGCTAAKSAPGAAVGSDVVAATTSPTPSTSASVAGRQPAAQPVYAPIVLTSSLGTKVRDVAFTEPLEISLRGGSGAAHLQNVTLTTGATAVEGTYDAARRAWKAGALAPSAGYTLTAVVADGRTTKSWKRSFSTIRPATTLTASVFPEAASTVGVGIPIIVSFNHPVQNKAAVEKALAVTSSTGGVVGAWHWDADDSVSYRPKQYWPGNIKVSVAARLAGVKAGDGLWGVADVAPVSFSIGDSIVNKVNLAADVMQVVINGKIARTVPVTGGQSGMNTRSGVSVISQKYADIQMDSESVGYAKGSANYYNLMVHWAMRITDSGEFLHAAPWSEWAQGHENVSHGCVGMSTDDAYWLYDHTNIGDVVEITGTTRPLEQGNGWTDWNMSWKDWLAGSALHVAQRT